MDASFCFRVLSCSRISLKKGSHAQLRCGPALVMPSTSQLRHSSDFTRYPASYAQCWASTVIAGGIRTCWSPSATLCLPPFKIGHYSLKQDTESICAQLNRTDSSPAFY